MIFSTTSEKKIKYLDAKKILPNRAQPRIDFKSEEIIELADSIKENGLLQPISVRRLTQNKYELISGERRLRAFNYLNIDKIPCILIDCDDEQSSVFALIENLQRSNLNAFEEAEAIYKLMKQLDMTQEEVAKKLGKRQSTVANKLRILKLTEEERKKIVEFNLTERHARALLKLKEGNERKQTLDYIILRQMNVQQSEEFINKILENKANPKKEKHRKIIIKDVRIFMNTIDKAIKTMKCSGINALSKKRETEDYLEYMVRIPKEIAASPIVNPWKKEIEQRKTDNNRMEARMTS